MKDQAIVDINKIVDAIIDVAAENGVPIRSMDVMNHMIHALVAELCTVIRDKDKQIKNLSEKLADYNDIHVLKKDEPEEFVHPGIQSIYGSILSCAFAKAWFIHLDITPLPYNAALPCDDKLGQFDFHVYDRDDLQMLLKSVDTILSKMGEETYAVRKGGE